LILGSKDEIVNVYSDEDCCCMFIGIVGIAAVGIEIIIVSDAMESNGFKCSVERCCPFETRLWKSI
jgi:hypothetical protein